MRPSTYVPSFYFYKLAQAISSPYTSLDAYSAGSIDANGNIVKPESSIDAFEYLVIKLKKIFDQLPYGTTKAQLSNYMATLQMFSEEVETQGVDKVNFELFLDGVITNISEGKFGYYDLCEDMSTGGGAGPGPGGLGVPASPEVSQGGVAGYDPIMALGLKRKKAPKYFNNCEVFEVCPEEYISFKSAKQWKDVPDSETKNYLQRFQRRNKNAKIGIKSMNPISGDQDLYWINYPAKNFMEEVDFDLFDMLMEETGKYNLKKVATAQYSAVSNFLDNHVKNLHDVADDEDIEIDYGNNNIQTIKTKDLNSAIRSHVNKVHTEEQQNKSTNSTASFTIKTNKGSLKAVIPHVSSHGTPDLTIEDSYVSNQPIKIDTKSARGRWENQTGKFQDDNKKPKRIPISEFETGKPEKNSFTVIHDSEGNITYVDRSHMPNVKKLLAKAYVKSGSSRRPGRFGMIGEIGMRLAKKGITKAFKKHMPFMLQGDEAVLGKSAQSNFAQKLGELTNTTFGKNDMYTSMFKKKSPIRGSYQS